MKISELDTPALVVDLDVLQGNLERMATYTKTNGLRLRPHTKTHKSPMLARKQLALGASGLTVAKVSEAEVMLEAQPKEILVAYPTIGAAKLARLKEVAKRSQISVSLDSFEAARQLSEAGIAAKVLVEFDAGLGRVGVPPEDLLALVKQIAALPHIEFDGLAFYPGHIKKMDEAGERQIVELSQLVEKTVDGLRQAGLAPRIVSGGSTPAWAYMHQVAGLNEVRPGTYIFNDRNTIEGKACSLDQCAATVIATVVSTAKPGQVLIDGGSKTFSSDRLNGDQGVSFGYVTDAPEAHFHKMNEEHGFLDISKCGRQFHVGDRVRILMNHVCVVMNLHEQVYGVRGDEVVESWPVAGRGKLQ